MFTPITFPQILAITTGACNGDQISYQTRKNILLNTDNSTLLTFSFKACVGNDQCSWAVHKHIIKVGRQVGLASADEYNSRGEVDHGECNRQILNQHHERVYSHYVALPIGECAHYSGHLRMKILQCSLLRGSTETWSSSFWFISVNCYDINRLVIWTLLLACHLTKWIHYDIVHKKVMITLFPLENEKEKRMFLIL